jgi:sarcosine oxidase, subunit gamma
MSETATRRRFPLDAFRTRRTDAVTIEPLGPAARLSLRCRDEAAIARVGEAFGTALPREACRFTESGTRRALWLGPDEWMLVVAGEAAGALGDSLADALRGTPHSLVDVSERSVSLAVSGPHAETLLAAGCPLDLSLAATPVGFVSRTVFAKSEIVLSRTEAVRFEIDVWRSFAPYVSSYLAEAARELSA